jgi:high-affinity Fe2+/Pb2+ permease
MGQKDALTTILALTTIVTSHVQANSKSPDYVAGLTTGHVTAAIAGFLLIWPLLR